MTHREPLAPWQCPTCSQEVDGEFALCWNCGTTVDGTRDPGFETVDAVDTAHGGREQAGWSLAPITLIVLSIFAVVAGLPTVIDLVLITAVAALCGRVARSLLDAPADEGSGIHRHDGTSQAHCIQCIQPISNLQQYCGHCGACVGQFAPYLPFERIPYYCQFFGQLFKRVISQDYVPRWKRVSYFGLILVSEPLTILGWLLRIPKLWSDRSQPT